MWDNLTEYCRDHWLVIQESQLGRRIAGLWTKRCWNRRKHKNKLIKQKPVYILKPFYRKVFFISELAIFLPTCYAYTPSNEGNIISNITSSYQNFVRPDETTRISISLGLLSIADVVSLFIRPCVRSSLIPYIQNLH